MKRSVSFCLLALCAFYTFSAGFAYAACVSPVGADGEIEYDSTNDIFTYCDNTNWIDMSSAPITGLQAHWKFDDGTGNSTATDSANSFDSTLTGMDSATDWVTGKIGQALIFDGAVEYVSIGDVALIDGKSAFTIAVWAKVTDNTTDHVVIGARGGGGCSTPDGLAGALNYDSAGNVYQYCDGANWVDIGKL